MAFPFAAIGAGLGLGKALLGGLGKNKQAKEQNRANQAGFKARQMAFHDNEQARAARLGGMQKFLGNYQSSLAADAPSYQIDPETLAALSKERTYAEAAPADVSKGGGMSLLSGLLGAGGDIANQAALGQLGSESVPAAPQINVPQFHYDPRDYELAPGAGVLAPK